MGAARLREGALSSAQVQKVVNDNMVALWVNIREDEVPRVDAIKSLERTLMLGVDRKSTSPPALGFFIRSYIVTPDGQTLLNEDDGMVRRTIPEWQPYLKMLRDSLERYNKHK